MKKLLLITLFSLAGLVALDATARNRDCGTCHVKPKCSTPCHKPLKTREIIDNRDLTPPCCERAVVVQEPAICHEIIEKSCFWECPSNCSTVAGKKSQYHDALMDGYASQTARVMPLERTMIEE
jgi:hypothetical protein